MLDQTSASADLPELLVECVPVAVLHPVACHVAVDTIRIEWFVLQLRVCDKAISLVAKLVPPVRRRVQIMNGLVRLSSFMRAHPGG